MENSNNLELEIKLQTKKANLRKELAEMGPIAKDKKNDFAKYSYLSESKYKSLFTELFSKHGLELTSSCDKVERFEIAGGQQGRIVHWFFKLTDTETGYSETTACVGEGFDKGDKAVYKAHTGALKYFFANSFLVATGDEAENDSPQRGYTSPQWATHGQIERLAKLYTGENLSKLLAKYKVATLEQMPYQTAESILSRCDKRRGNGQ